MSVDSSVDSATDSLSTAPLVDSSIDSTNVSELLSAEPTFGSVVSVQAANNKVAPNNSEYFLILIIQSLLSFSYYRLAVSLSSERIP